MAGFSFFTPFNFSIINERLFDGHLLIFTFISLILATFIKYIPSIPCKQMGLCLGLSFNCWYIKWP